MDSKAYMKLQEEKDLAHLLAQEDKENSGG